jgi:osmoprotectant transport system permease protein
VKRQRGAGCQPAIQSFPLRLAVSLFAAALIWPAAGVRAESTEIRIGSKAFTESVILGEMLTCLAESGGLHASHRAELAGTQIAWQALRRGEIDAYVEYTGTLTEEIFAGRGLAGDPQIVQALAQDGICMSGRLGLNNTYALAMREDDAQRRGIRRISDLASHPELRFGVSDEFMERKDGWAGLQARYKLPQKTPRDVDHALAYRGLAAGKLDATDICSTDPEIVVHDLRVLEDDLGYFPSYYAVVLYRADLQQRAPAFVQAIHRLEGRIDSSTMTRLNAQVRVDGKPEAFVAASFLQGAIDPSISVPPLDANSQYGRMLERFERTTREHVFLVAVSLVAAIAFAVPLGIVAYRRPKLGNVILGVVGVIQTLPSMALLVFMIPFFGLGAWPAIITMFLYSLLPIVRNTATGLREIPGSVHQSALALGLPSLARLRLVELPMASRSILSGIKTAAVINVGTATIGAFIGAGGYGQPILTGVRLADLNLILQGAIPAAAMALLAQALFGGAERWLVPRGLRL